MTVTQEYAQIMFAEEAHEAGADGVRKAKHWLDATTRVEVRWVYPDSAAKEKLTHKWHDGSTFVFDLAGVFSQSGPTPNVTFMAEVKNYSTAGSQGTMYTEYLARCFRAREENPGFAEQFMWITWHPFSVGKWSRLTTPEEVRNAVLLHHARALGTASVAEAESALTDEACRDLAERLWLLVLSEKHELLALSPEDRIAVLSAQIARAS